MVRTDCSRWLKAACAGGAWLGALSGMLGMAGCAPELNWRDTVLGETSLHLQMPCKPTRFARPVRLASVDVSFEMLVCDAGGATWAVAHADVRDPAQVGEATSQLLQAASANIGAEPTPQSSVVVPGMTPNTRAGRALMQGHRPDGTVVRQHVAAFSHGAQVFQATVVSAPGQLVSVEPFFDSLRFAPPAGAHSGP